MTTTTDSAVRVASLEAQARRNRERYEQMMADIRRLTATEMENGR